MELIGAIDQGTTSTRFIVFTRSGKIVSVSQEEYRFESPSPGWAETNPQVILDTVVRTVNRAYDDLVSKGIDPGSLKWIGLTNQRESLVAWDKKGNPVHNAILWLDNRTEAFLDEVKKDLGDKYNDVFKHVRQATGLRPSSYFTATKIHWMLANIPGFAEKVLKQEVLLGTVDSWILYKLLGGVHVTDVSNASRTLMFNIAEMCWDPSLIKMFVLGRFSDVELDSSELKNVSVEDIISCLPNVYPSQHNYGSVTLQDIKFVSKSHGLQIGGVCGDQQSALIGHLGFEQGATKVTFGTGAFVLSNAGNKEIVSHLSPTSPLLATVLCQFELDCHGDGKGKEKEVFYALEGSVSNAGTTVEQLVRLGIAETPQHLDRLAEKVYIKEGESRYPRNSCVVVPAFNGLFGSRWDDTARCIISGISYATGREHICRAALEGIAYQTAEILDEMLDGEGNNHIMVDGGVTNSDVFLRIMSNISNAELVKSDMVEATAFGVAIIAGLTSGLYTSFKDVESSVIEIKKRYRPEMSEEERSEGWKRWNDAVARCHGLSEFD